MGVVGSRVSAQLGERRLRTMRDTTVTDMPLGVQAPQRRREPGVAVLFSRAPMWPVPVVMAEPLKAGRSDTAEVSLDDKAVSWEHAVLEPHPDGILVTDGGSRNGTFVDGAPVSAPRTLAPFGSLIRMGGSLLVASDDVLAFAYDEARNHPGFVGGPSLDEVRARIAMIAATRDPVLLEGETGTGKEVAAQALHEASGRRGRLVGLNCAAVAPELVESELFGHARGAFSGATAARSGLFRSADQGTLLLDEIGEMPLSLQAKLLRVVESGVVRAVGDDREIPVDVRIVAATNRNLEECVADGSFRADLLHRIAAVRLVLPPLRERREDLPLLCGDFLSERQMSITATALERLWIHAWPGNLRELKNLMHAAASAAAHDGRDVVHPEDLRALDASSGDDLRSRILDALNSTRGNMTQAARRIGMARSVLYETVKRLRLDPDSFRGRSK